MWYIKVMVAVWLETRVQTAQLTSVPVHTLSPTRCVKITQSHYYPSLLLRDVTRSGLRILSMWLAIHFHPLFSDLALSLPQKVRSKSGETALPNARAVGKIDCSA